MADEEESNAVAILLIGYAFKLKCFTVKRRRRRRVWVKEYLQGREERGTYMNLLRELEISDFPEDYRKIYAYGYTNISGDFAFIFCCSFHSLNVFSH